MYEARSSYQGTRASGVGRLPRLLLFNGGAHEGGRRISISKTENRGVWEKEKEKTEDRGGGS
jgi:hypothetical protein